MKPTPSGPSTFPGRRDGCGPGACCIADQSAWQGQFSEREALLARDKANLDLFWIKDEDLEASENLPAPEVLAREIVEDLQAALDAFTSVDVALEKE